MGDYKQYRFPLTHPLTPLHFACQCSLARSFVAPCRKTGLCFFMLLNIYDVCSCPFGVAGRKGMHEIVSPLRMTRKGPYPDRYICDEAGLCRVLKGVRKGDGKITLCR